MLFSIIRFLQSWKRYGTAVQELSQLSDRELADIGITRGDIPRIAWEHADYGDPVSHIPVQHPRGTAVTAGR